MVGYCLDDDDDDDAVISKYTHRQGWEMDGGKVAEVKLADYSQWLQKLLSGRLTTTATEND